MMITNVQKSRIKIKINSTIISIIEIIKECNTGNYQVENSENKPRVYG